MAFILSQAAAPVQSVRGLGFKLGIQPLLEDFGRSSVVKVSSGPIYHLSETRPSGFACEALWNEAGGRAVTAARRNCLKRCGTLCSVIRTEKYFSTWWRR